MTVADEAVFLELVGESRERRCQAALDAARADAQQVLGAARRDARQRVARAILASREQRARELSAARAELGTRLRLVVQRTEERWLALAWPRLEAELQARWRAPDSRRRWIASALALGRARLEPGWRIEHPLDLPEGELSMEGAELVPSDAITAGIRIASGSAVLDATAAGLLRRADSVKGRLLAELEK
jgi:hypothetical protein